MQYFRSIDEIELNIDWITIGVFDGVHLGHQVIIDKIVNQAKKGKLHSAVVTFFPHPKTVLRGARGQFYLTTPEERADLLGALGVDFVITQKFDKELENL